MILHNAGVECACVGSDVRESEVSADDPRSLVQKLASLKAAAVQARYPDAVVIAADQLAVDVQFGDVHGKPPDTDAHRARLLAMRGRAHDLVTGWVVRAPERTFQGLASTRMTVRGDVTADEIDRYIASGEGSHCAGGYAVEGSGVFLFERIDGDWFNVIGLPLLDVLGALRQLGWRR